MVTDDMYCALTRYSRKSANKINCNDIQMKLIKE